MDILIIAWQCLQIYGLYLLLVAVHEAGHLITGALLGYRWNYWIVGPLKVSREMGECALAIRGCGLVVVLVSSVIPWIPGCADPVES